MHKYYGLNELREMFLTFFESKGHLRLPSFPLVPENDPSLLLINAGMAPMKPWFKGEEEPPRRRVCTCQKCIRTGDIENIGHTARHGTYFEMLGNFSFGDYFKHEAIAWTWEFLTDPKWVGLEKDRLYPSVYQEDDEAFNIWRDEVGIPEDRIYRMGKDESVSDGGFVICRSVFSTVSGDCGIHEREEQREQREKYKHPQTYDEIEYVKRGGKAAFGDGAHGGSEYKDDESCDYQRHECDGVEQRAHKLREESDVVACSVDPGDPARNRGNSAGRAPEHRYCGKREHRRRVFRGYLGVYG